MILDKINDKIQGKLEKMLIMSFKNAAEAATGNKQNAIKVFSALINPEKYKLNHTTVFVEGDQAPGTSGTTAKYNFTQPIEMSFDFLFDDTGIIDGDFRGLLKKPNEGIIEDIKEFQEVLFEFNGEIHQPAVVKLVWGNLLFIGRATSVNIEYKLFNSSGEPIRAIASVGFRCTSDDEKRAAKEAKKSPDLTHIVKVKAGDTLPLLCQKIYGKPKYYLQIASANGLGNFRYLEPGTELLFPPIDKMKN